MTLVLNTAQCGPEVAEQPGAEQPGAEWQPEPAFPED